MQQRYNPRKELLLMQFTPSASHPIPRIVPVHSLTHSLTRLALLCHVPTPRFDVAQAFPSLTPSPAQFIDHRLMLILKIIKLISGSQMYRAKRVPEARSQVKLMLLMLMQMTLA
jgi:hypothetical protein